MVYPRHWRFQFGGSLLGDGGDIWTNTINFSGGGIVGDPVVFSAGDRATQLDALMDKLRTRFVLQFTAGGLGYSNAVRLKWGKFNEIGPEGRYSDTGVTTVKDLVPTVPGSGLPPSYAPQLAMAVTWRTEVQRGLANSGRIFIPMPAVGPDSSARLTPLNAGHIATNWAKMLKEFADLPGFDANGLAPYVVSGVREGAQHKITDVWMGDIIDTVRSRRNAFKEIYIRRNVDEQTLP